MTEGVGMTKLADKVLARRAGVTLVLVNLGGAAVYSSLTTMNWVISQEPGAPSLPQFHRGKGGIARGQPASTTKTFKPLQGLTPALPRAR